MANRTSDFRKGRDQPAAVLLELDLHEILSGARVRLETLRLPDEGVAITEPVLTETIRFALAHVDIYGGDETPVPVEVVSRAREAAINDTPLELLLRRCFAVHSVVDDHILMAADKVSVPAGAVRLMLAGQANVFGRLSDAIVEEYGRWSRGRTKSPADRALRLVSSTLAGRLPTGPILTYPLADVHLAGVAVPEAMDTVERLAATRGMKRLTVRAPTDVSWFWIHSDSPRTAHELATEIECRVDAPMAVGLGEPGDNSAGWRRSHRQAEVAFELAAEQDGGVVRYRQVALLAAARNDSLLAESLMEIYLKPLRSSRDQGLDLLSTLRAYFRADRNRASAAAAMGISRQAVSHRLGIAEERLREPLRSCGLALETALLLEQSRD